MYDGSCEDLFFYVNRLIAEACGAEVAGRLHTARSRNDIDMTMYRMRLRECVLTLAEAVARRCGRRSIDVADAHRETVFPAHTHTQPAQPTTVAHYLLARRRATRAGHGASARGLRDGEPQSARRLRHHGHGVSHRSRPHERRSWDSRDRPATPTAASRRWTTCSRAAARPSMLRRRPRPLRRRTCCCGATRGDRLPAAAGRVRAGEQHHAAEAESRSRSSTRGRSSSKALARVERRRARSSHNTPFGDIVDTEDDLQPLVAAAFATRRRAVSLRGGDDGGGGVRRRADARARGATAGSR